MPAGLLLGMESAGWSDVPLVVVETEGSNCLELSLRQGRVVTIDDIDTIATSLGARYSHMGAGSTRKGRGGEAFFLRWVREVESGVQEEFGVKKKTLKISGVSHF